jgi:hypothetical protein
MKDFQLTPKMLTMGGAFYPTGYAVLMFAQAQEADQAGRQLEEAGFDGQSILRLTPETILHDIAKVDGESDFGLPSVGTEGATVNKYVQFARQGHHGLMVHAPSDKDTERLTAALSDLHFSYGQKYHMLAIEDLD